MPSNIQREEHCGDEEDDYFVFRGAQRMDAPKYFKADPDDDDGGGFETGLFQEGVDPLRGEAEVHLGSDKGQVNHE